MTSQFVELLWFATYAELRAERARSYLGLLWWLFEPAMNMAVYYLVFARILHVGGDDFVAFLLVGLTLWQWFKSCISHGGHAIWLQLGLVRQVHVPVRLFPSVQVLADTVKFFCILAVLIALLWLMGYPPSAAYCALPLVLLIEFICATGAAYLVAALLPFVPDVRFVIEQLLQVLMFLSGVVFALDVVPQPLRDWLAINPIAELIDAGRGILLHARWPAPGALLRAAAISLTLYGLGVWSIVRLTPRFVKLPT
jgi:lipopolysaccharide transport system permease protein